jgi:predicted transcriptional regulator
MTNKSIIWTDCNTTVVLEILEASKNGITKREITNKLSTLSHVQLRRCLAELIDKRLLHYDELQSIYNTTDRGLVLIKNIQSQ